MQAYIRIHFESDLQPGDTFQYRIFLDGVPVMGTTTINMEAAANPPYDVAVGANQSEAIDNILTNFQAEWAHEGISYVRVGSFILIAITAAESVSVDSIVEVPGTVAILFAEEGVIGPGEEKPTLTLTFDPIPVWPENYYFRFDVGILKQFTTTFVNTITGENQARIGPTTDKTAQNYMYSLMANNFNRLDEFVFSHSNNIVTVVSVSNFDAFTAFYHYDTYPSEPAEYRYITHIVDNDPDFVTTAISDTRLNFTGDHQPVILNKYLPPNIALPINETYYIEFSMDIEVYDYAGVSKTVTYNGKVPFNGDTARFFPGPVIAGVMEKLNSPSQVLDAVLVNDVETVNNSYNPARVSIYLREIRAGNGAVYTEKILTDYDFLKGVTPPAYAAGNGVLAVNEAPVRVTKNGYTLFNFCKTAGAHDIVVLRNTQEHETINHDPGSGSHFLFLYGFSDFTEGDVIEIQIAEGANTFSRKYVVFPDGMQSVHIGWEDAYGNLQLYEFTGAWNVATDYKRISHQYYRNFVTVLENLSTQKQQKINCNTGFILKSNHTIIDSIMRAKKAWFVFPDQDKHFEIIPVSERLSNEDTRRDLYDYTLEFYINSDDDHSIYPY